MPPASSLIFVVILAVWAVYLVQHWVRRRDHLATARSVDRFSEAMRVLERRRALPRPDLSEHVPAAAPLLRPARPAVVVKHGSAPAALGSTAVGPSAEHRRRRLAAQARAVGLVLASLVMVVLVALVVAEVIAWGWSFVGVAVLAGTLVAIRWSVARQRAQSRQSRRNPQSRQSPQSLHGRQGRSGRSGATAARSRDGAGADRGDGRPAALDAQAAAAVSLPGMSAPSGAAAPRTARRAVDLEPRRPAAALYDIDEIEAGLTVPPAADTSAQHVPAVAQHEPVSTGWSPVPVPPPTYTLKAKAHRGLPTDLPVDGTDMALDEEFEDLPEVGRVG